MKVVRKGFAGAILALGAAAAHASAGYLVYCNHCDSTQIATAVLNSGAGVGVPVYVGDPVTGAYATYQIYQDVDDSHKPPLHTRQVENTTGDPKILNGVHQSLQFYAITPVGWNKKFDVTYTGPDGTATGWTVSMAGSPEQNNFNSWLNSPGSGAKTASILLGSFWQALGIVTKADPGLIPSAMETVTFSDGSSIQGIHDNSCACLKADPSTAKDAEGNGIPYIDALGRIQNFGGLRKYPDTYQGDKDYQKYVNQIASMPVILQLGPGGDQIGGGGNGSTVQPIICVETDDEHGNKQITCTRG